MALLALIISLRMPPPKIPTLYLLTQDNHEVTGEKNVD